MKIIICKTDGAEIMVDDEDYEVLSRFPWYRGGVGKHPMTFFYGKNDTSHTVYMHQIIMGGMVGADHIDLNVMNMQKSNLRAATAQQNGWNKGKPKANRHGENTSKYKGVSKYKDSKGNEFYRVIIKLTRKGEKPAKYYRVSGFKYEDDAARCYDKKVVELRGKFAWTNLLNNNETQSLPSKG